MNDILDGVEPQINDHRQTSTMVDGDIVTIDRGEYERLKADSAARWATFGDERPPGTVTSVLHCGVCGDEVEVRHPILPWQFHRLPDVSWVRCHRYACKRVVP